MSVRHHFLRRVSWIASVLFAACSEPTGSAPAAVFVLRSIAGEPIPATIVLNGQSYTALADTLYLPTPSADGRGILRRAVAAGYRPLVPRLVRGNHEFIWRGSVISVVFGCQATQMCLAILSYESGTLTDRTLVFPGNGGFAPERRYERIR